VETDKAAYSKMLLGLTQLAGVPVKVTPTDHSMSAEGLSALETSPAVALRKLLRKCVHRE